MVDRKTFSSRLVKLRERDRVTIVELGEAIGLSKQSINNFENQRNLPSLDMFVALADYFGVSTDYLLGRTDNLTSHIHN